MAARAEGGWNDVDPGAVEERLRSIDESLRRIEDQRLSKIEEHLGRLNGRVGELEKWQAGADAMFDSLNERVNENSDRFEKHCAEKAGELREQARELKDITQWMNEQKGGLSARAQMLAHMCTVVGILVALIKLLFFHS